MRRRARSFEHAGSRRHGVSVNVKTDDLRGTHAVRDEREQTAATADVEEPLADQIVGPEKCGRLNQGARDLLFVQEAIDIATPVSTEGNVAPSHQRPHGYLRIASNVLTGLNVQTETRDTHSRNPA